MGLPVSPPGPALWSCPQCGTGVAAVRTECGQVCGSCGTVVEENFLVNEEDRGIAGGGHHVFNDGLQLPTFTKTRLYGTEALDTRKLRRAFLEIKGLSRTLHLSQDMLNQAKHLLKELYELCADFRKPSISRLLAGVCCRLVLLNNGGHISLMDVALRLHAKVFELGKIHRKVRSLLVFRPEWKAAFDFVEPGEGHLGHCYAALQTAGVLSAFGIESQEAHMNIKELATRLLSMGHREWVTAGRQPIIVTAAAVGLALETECHDKTVVLRRIAEALHVTVAILKKRRKELVLCLLAGAKALPGWEKADECTVLGQARMLLQQLDINNSLQCLPDCSFLGQEPNLSVGPLTEPVSYKRSAEKQQILLERLKRVKQHTLAIDLGAHEAALPLDEKDLHVQRMMLAGYSDSAILTGHKLERASTIGQVRHDLDNPELGEEDDNLSDREGNV